MVADFRTEKVNTDKVSKAVKNFVRDVAKIDANKKKIDSDREFFALSEYLSGNSHLMNKDEIGYIQGYVFEYQDLKQKKFEDEQVTDNTKKEVAKIRQRTGDKNKIDSDEEAQALSLMLRDTHSDLNQADIIYIKNLLINSGYGCYLPELQPKPLNVVNVIVNETVIEEKKEECENNSKESGEVRNDTMVSKNVTPPKPKKKQPSIIQKENFKVDEAARAQGFGIANKIQEELHDSWTNNKLIQKEFRRVNTDNAYSFVGKMLEVTDSHTVFGDSIKRINYSILKYVTANFLNQALKLELGKTSAWQNLKAEYVAINRQIQKDPDKTPDEYDIDRLNKAFKALYDEMSKVFR